MVDLALRRLFVKEEDEILKDHPIGIGRYGGSTPVGVFKIAEIVDNPLEEYSNGVIYGVGCINLDVGVDDRPYAIHGTNEPESVGKAMSSGCMRMYNEDFKELRCMVLVGTIVIITVSTLFPNERPDASVTYTKE